MHNSLLYKAMYVSIGFLCKLAIYPYYRVYKSILYTKSVTAYVYKYIQRCSYKSLQINILFSVLCLHLFTVNTKGSIIPYSSIIYAFTRKLM